MQNFFESVCVIGLSQVTAIIYPCIFNREQQQDNKSVTWLPDGHINFSVFDFSVEFSKEEWGITLSLIVLIVNFCKRKTEMKDYKIL